MVHRIHFRSAGLALAAAAAVALVAAGCSRDGSVSNAAPRITAVPAQSTAGGSPFSIDLDDYVSDREAGTLTYTVASGGGSFTGSSYTHTFDAMGEYTVDFTVSDGAKTANGSFVVNVASSNFVVVREDNDGLFLLDSATNGQVRVLSSTNAPTFAAGLADGRMVFQINGNQLWIYDPIRRTATRIAGDAAGAATYVAKTSDSRFVYQTGTAPDVTLFYYNPVNDFSREIDDGGLASTDVFINSSNLVFYETGVTGQSDIYYYDPEEDDSFAVGAAETDEQLLGLLGNGGIVFSRIGTGGETDLFYFRVGTGVVEIGADIAALATRNKAFHAGGAGSEVVFSATNAGNRELFAWDPGTGQTATIVSGSDNVFDGIGDGNEVVYHTVVSGTEHDAFCYDIDDSSTVTVRDQSDVTTVIAVTKGTPAYAIVQGSGATTQIDAVSLVGSPATVSWTPGATVNNTVGQLDNGDVVAQRADGTAINNFDVSGGAWGTQITGAGLAFEGDGLESGDFVFTVTVSAQVDLSMWDESGAAVVVVSNTAGTDDFQAKTADGTLLFTRIVGTNTNADLFTWDGTTETRLTDEDTAGLKHDHTVLGQFTGTR
ncbi:MAG: PKD domain-containing protein [bacterium]|nr:PKD domain-containing protein [bacterium]